MNFCHLCFGWATVAPLDHLIHLFLIAFENSLYGAISAVFNPAVYSQFKSHLLSVVPEEDPLDSPFNDDACPYFFHIDSAGACPAGPPPEPSSTDPGHGSRKARDRRAQPRLRSSLLSQDSFEIKPKKSLPFGFVSERPAAEREAIRRPN